MYVQIVPSTVRMADTQRSVVSVYFIASRFSSLVDTPSGVEAGLWSVRPWMATAWPSGLSAGN